MCLLVLGILNIKMLHIGEPVMRASCAPWPGETLQYLPDLAREHHPYLVSDEGIAYDGAVAASLATLVGNDPSLKDRVISVLTFSRSSAMTGSLSWVVAVGYDRPCWKDRDIRRYGRNPYTSSGSDRHFRRWPIRSSSRKPRRRDPRIFGVDKS